ncbi:MAG: Stp1/IreP family PP2C-type Ser/Thr phosphatase [Clostridia bacterium]|nr:Stp1/IreP family PP2C-type Ser/Thr phosphatase [Clostridia bacterium]
MQIGFKTDKGNQRSNNEDACFVMFKEETFIVADGVGGEKSGELASRTAVIEASNFLEKKHIEEISDELELKNTFVGCIDYINQVVRERGFKHVENNGMATTVVIGHKVGNSMYFANVGDSRAYVLTQGELFQITEDHTYVQQLVNQGVITQEQARNHMDRHAITRAIGVEGAVEADFYKIDLRKGDVILLCTDGLYEELSHEEIKELMSRDLDMKELSEEFIRAANNNGGSDNITLICLKVMEDDIDE